MKCKYVKWHNNYNLNLNETYKGRLYNDRWILIEGVLYRKECFELENKQ